ncbi:hypothetical protein [Symbioplanes lichenis]|uniref:hypothetical protein n=1 Tax=Symbioplanes lichenis TaxID=1629072 RepID=UPI0027391D7E|nr:hypothetical protein [Actinoplanes lichenis]
MIAVMIGLAGVAVALAALGAALWQGTLLRRQLSHAGRVSNAQFYQTITVQWLEFDKFLIDRPRLWPYFHANLPVPEDEGEHAELLCMAAFMANMAEIGVNSKAMLGPLSGDWEKYFRFVYGNSPFFRYFWGRYKSMWSDEVDAVFTTPVPGFPFEKVPEPALAA